MELFKPEFGLAFWMFIAFLCLFLILAKWAWPFIIKSMEERADLRHLCNGFKIRYVKAAMASCFIQ